MKAKVLVVVLTLAMVGCKNTAGDADKLQEVTTDTIVSVDTLVVDIEKNQSIRLIKKHVLSQRDLYVDYDGGSQLADFFKIELIDKETFLKNRSNEVEFFTLDSTSIRKQNGILRLPCTKKVISLVDNLTEGEDFKEYTYRGQVKDLNAYLVSGIYWEDWNYFLVDKYAGRTIQTFTNFPHLSPDDKFIISIEVNSIEGAAYIDLYEVSGKRYVDPLIGMFAKNWIPMGNDKIYWGEDNYLYLAVLSNQDYWAADGDYEGLDQYIRLRPIAA